MRLPTWQRAYPFVTCERHLDHSGVRPMNEFIENPRILARHVVCFTGPRPMKSAPRSFSSTGKISRSALIAAAVLVGVTAATAVVVAQRGRSNERTSAVDAGRRAGSGSSMASANAEGCPDGSRSSSKTGSSRRASAPMIRGQSLPDRLRRHSRRRPLSGPRQASRHARRRHDHARRELIRY